MVLFGQFRYCSGFIFSIVCNTGIANEKLPVYAGVQDALVQWWYGHNVAFFLTTPYLGLMYYFIPKAAIVQYILIDCLLFTFGR
jgi:cbb3-type cytochrome oxidase subunit 1